MGKRMGEDITEAIFYYFKNRGKNDEEAYKLCDNKFVQAIYERAVEKAKQTIELYFTQLLDACEEYKRINENYLQKI